MKGPLAIYWIVFLVVFAAPSWGEESNGEAGKAPLPAGRILTVKAPNQEQAKLAPGVAEKLSGIAEGVSMHALETGIVIVLRADVPESLDNDMKALVESVWRSSEEPEPKNNKVEAGDRNEIISVRHVKAADIAKQLKKKDFGFTIEALGEDRLMVGWFRESASDPSQAALTPVKLDGKPANSSGTGAPPEEPSVEERLNLLRDAIDQLDRPHDSTSGVESSVVRIYYADAGEVATALNDKVGGLSVAAVGPDQVVISGAQPLEEEQVGELKRRIALLDMPRPQVGLQIWSLQLSSEKPEQVRTDAQTFRTTAQDLDEKIQQAFDRGWNYIVALTAEHLKAKAVRPEQAGPLDTHLFRYLTTAIDDACKDDAGYCLNYKVEENAYPSMSKMIFVLASAEKPQEAAGAMVNKMAEYNCRPTNTRKLCFHSFRQALQALLSEPRASRLRAAIADFLFNYKWSVQYPHDFGDYSLARSAENLNALFDPVFTAYNRDVGDHIEKTLRTKLEGVGAQKRYSGLADRGMVSVQAVGGESATVEAGSASYFDVTVPPDPTQLVADFGTKGRELIAGLYDQQPTVVEVQRGIKATFTPWTLPTGAGAELAVRVETGEGDAPPVQVGADDPNEHALDRVAKHIVDTKVRVAPLRLFELSTFAQQVHHPQLPGTVPVIGQAWDYAFGGVPGLNGLFKWRRKAKPMAHRSLLLVNATVVPTAMDLGLGVRFESDRTGSTRHVSPRSEWRDWHFLMHKCFIRSPSPNDMDSCIEQEALKLPDDRETGGSKYGSNIAQAKSR